ncbi:PadR family transcriptional regulator [Patulibacter defluvii]|uniref:PadR family transcriptional regulator n=1 Tax=Patulibacter defluvii TaxID=3095358 RepID=UPI002A764754|nr:PadR family transcriptional regulator [Patulibacter sp. DM4]
MTAHAHHWGRPCGPHPRAAEPFGDPRWLELLSAMTSGRGPGRRGGPGRHGRGPRGGPPGFPGFPGGPGGPPFPGGPRGRGPRAGRGDVRAALLLVLEEQETANGYQLMQEIEERSHGAWRPSPGSVYPSLQQLEDEGLVQGEQRGNGRFFALTDAGKAHVEEHRERLGQPWEAAAGGISDQAWKVGSLMREVGFAAFQVTQAGSPAQQAEAAEVLTETRRRLYRILADGDGDEADPEAPAEA